jgi:hypothetical protein
VESEAWEVHYRAMKSTAAHARWGRRLAFVECLAFVLFLAQACSQQIVAQAMTVEMALAFAAGSSLILWRLLRGRPGEPSIALGQTAAMPLRWRRSALGESERNDG